MAKQKFTDTELIVALNLNEDNITHAARDLGVTRAAVIKRRDALPKGALITDVEEFKNKRADLFADLQLKALKMITPDKLAQASITQLSTFIGTMYDKERLEKNLSTENIAHKVSERLSDEDKAEFKKLMEARTQRLREAVEYDD